MPQLTVVPNPAAPSTVVDVNGTGFANKKTRLLLDGVGATTNVFRPQDDGTFSVGITVSGSPKTQTLVAQQQTGNTWSEVARTSVVVQNATTPPPPTGPTIFAIQVINLTQVSAEVSWGLSEAATGRVEYGPTTAYGSQTTPETSLNYSAHQQPLTGLQPGTLYHFRVRSTNAAGVESVSADQTFTTVANVPGPEPSTRPWAAPVTTRTVDAPTTNLNAFLAAQPNGTYIRFPAGVTIPLNTGMLLAGKSNMILGGNGAKPIMSAGDAEANSPFLLRGSDHISILDFDVTGAYSGYPNPQGEYSHMVGLSGWYGGRESSYVEVAGITGRRFFGDFLYLEGENVGEQRPSHHVWMHHNVCDTVGRNAVSPINVEDVLVEDNRFDRMAYHAFDCEPNQNAESIRRVTFRRNTVGEYAARGGLIGFFFTCYSPNNPMVADITVEDNTVAGIAANGYDRTPRGLDAQIKPGPGVRYQRIAFRRNKTTRSISRNGVFYAARTDGVIVEGNVQPGSSDFAQFADCSAVVSDA